MENEEMSNIKDKLGEIINCLIIDTKKRKNSNITDMIYLKDNAKEDVIAILLPFIESEKKKSYEKGVGDMLKNIVFNLQDKRWGNNILTGFIEISSELLESYNLEVIVKMGEFGRAIETYEARSKDLISNEKKDE